KIIEQILGIAEDAVAGDEPCGNARVESCRRDDVAAHGYDATLQLRKRRAGVAVGCHEHLVRAQLSPRGLDEVLAALVSHLSNLHILEQHCARALRRRSQALHVASRMEAGGARIEESAMISRRADLFP